MYDKSTSSQEKETQPTIHGSNVTSAFLLDLRGKQNPYICLNLQPCFDTLAQMINLMIKL